MSLYLYIQIPKILIYILFVICYNSFGEMTNKCEYGLSPDNLFTQSSSFFHFYSYIVQVNLQTTDPSD